MATSLRRRSMKMRRTSFRVRFWRLGAPGWNTISDLRVPHPRSRELTAVQEVAFTLANGVAYVEAALAAAACVDRLRAAACPSSRCHIATSSRRRRPSSGRRGGCGAEIVRERFGAMVRRVALPAFPRADRGDRTLTAQQPAVQRRADDAGGASRRCWAGRSVAAHQRVRTRRWRCRRRVGAAGASRSEVIAYESGAADVSRSPRGSFLVSLDGGDSFPCAP